MDLPQLVHRVLNERGLQESDWLEWKSSADLGHRLWQARTARFILGAANRPGPSRADPYDDSAFLLLGVGPGAAAGTVTVDPAVVTQGLLRFLGSVGPRYSLDYVHIENVAVAVITVARPPPGNRPHLSRGTYSAGKEEIRDGRIYIRRRGVTAEASAAELDEMLSERIAVRLAAGPMWPMQAESVWRSGKALHVQKRRGDHVIVYEADLYTNLTEMAATRPSLPEHLPGDITERLVAFDRLHQVADSDPWRAIEEAWEPLRAIVRDSYEQLVGTLPFEGFKITRMVEELAHQGQLERGWVDASFPLYYWPIEQSPETVSANPGLAKTYVALAKDLAAVMLITVKEHKPAD